jgi:hypothetical protein
MVITFALALYMILSGLPGMLPITQAENDGDFKVKNLVPGFEIVWKSRQDTMIELKFRNNCDKAITAYQVRLGKLRNSQDFGAGGASLAPGQEYYVRKGLQPGEKLVVSAVVFDDGTFAGDPEFASNLRDRRKGQSVQYRRINRLLKRALAGDSTLSSIEAIQERIAALPQEPVSLLFGLYIAKQTAMHALSDLQSKHSESGQNLVVVQNGLNDLVERYTRTLAHLDAALNPKVRKEN